MPAGRGDRGVGDPLSRAPLPRDVTRFLVDHVASVDELEVLLFLRSRPLAEWNGRGAAELLGIAPDLVDGILRKLRGHDLVELREAPSRLYRYAPATAPSHVRWTGW